MQIQTITRTTKFTDTSPYCHLAGPEDTIEMTEWTNCEGVDITLINSLGSNISSFTYGELSALIALHNPNSVTYVK